MSLDTRTSLFVAAYAHTSGSGAGQTGIPDVSRPGELRGQLRDQPVGQVLVK